MTATTKTMTLINGHTAFVTRLDGEAAAEIKSKLLAGEDYESFWSVVVTDSRHRKTWTMATGYTKSSKKSEHNQFVVWYGSDKNARMWPYFETSQERAINKAMLDAWACA
jgi:hypothetical protein